MRVVHARWLELSGWQLWCCCCCRGVRSVVGAHSSPRVCVVMLDVLVYFGVRSWCALGLLALHASVYFCMWTHVLPDGRMCACMLPAQACSVVVTGNQGMCFCNKLLVQGCVSHSMPCCHTAAVEKTFPTPNIALKCTSLVGDEASLACMADMPRIVGVLVCLAPSFHACSTRVRVLYCHTDYCAFD